MDQTLGRLARGYVAGNTAAAFDFELAILDGSGDEARRPNQQASAHRELPLETPADVSALHRGGAGEEATLGDRDVSTFFDVGFDRAFDDQSIAAGDFAR